MNSANDNCVGDLHCGRRTAKALRKRHKEEMIGFWSLADWEWRLGFVKEVLGPSLLNWPYLTRGKYSYWRLIHSCFSQLIRRWNGGEAANRLII